MRIQTKMESWYNAALNRRTSTGHLWDTIAVCAHSKWRQWHISHPAIMDSSVAQHNDGTFFTKAHRHYCSAHSLCNSRVNITIRHLTESLKLRIKNKRMQKLSVHTSWRPNVLTSRCVTNRGARIQQPMDCPDPALNTNMSKGRMGYLHFTTIHSKCTQYY